MDQVLTLINDSPNGEHTISYRYALAESEEDSDSVEIQQMSLGPRRADLLRKKLEINEAEAQLGNPRSS